MGAVHRSRAASAVIGADGPEKRLWRFAPTWRRIALLVVSALVLAACAGQDPAGDAAEEPADETDEAAVEDSDDDATTEDATTEEEQEECEEVEDVAFGTVTSLNHVPYFVAVEEGIFLEHCLNLTVEQYGSGQDAATAMQAGEVTFTPAPFGSAASYEQGIPFRGVLASMGNPLLERSDTNFSIWTYEGSGIESLEDLEGANVGILLGSTMDQYLTSAFIDNGLDPTTVNKINVPIPDSAEVIASQDVDAVVVPEPQGTIIEDLDDSVMVMRGGDYVGYTITMAVAPDLVEERPDLMLRAARAYAQAAHFTRTNPDRAAEIVPRWLEGLDEDQARRALEHVPFDPRFSTNTFNGWTHGMEILIEEDRLTEVIPIEDLFVTDFIQQVQEENPEYFEDLEPLPEDIDPAGNS